MDIDLIRSFPWARIVRTSRLRPSLASQALNPSITNRRHSSRMEAVPVSKIIAIIKMTPNSRARRAVRK